MAGLVDAQAANITMRDVSAVVNYYQDKAFWQLFSSSFRCPGAFGSPLLERRGSFVDCAKCLQVLQEALARQVIVAKEALQETALKSVPSKGSRGLEAPNSFKSKGSSFEKLVP